LKKASLRNSILIVFIILAAGCGLKGNPVPYSTITEEKSLIKNLEAVSNSDSLTLKWNFRNNEGLIHHIYVERSENGASGNECRDCPRTFERIGQVTVGEALPGDKETTFSFPDEKAVKGKIYNYRLKLCENNGNCSESSSIEINYQ
jgi:hypothetical protein